MFARIRLLALLAVAACAVQGAAAATPSAGVAVVRNAEWALSDPVRDGAGELEIWLRVAQLQRQHDAAGVVAVGDHHGVLRSGGEQALRRVVYTGVAVVKLARAGGEVAATPDNLFIDAGALPEDHASRVLTRCLERYGAPPAAADPEHPTARERSAIQAHLKKFQRDFTAERTKVVALR